MINIVIIEDQIPILKQISVFLKNAPFDVRIVGECFNGKEGLDCVLRTKPDIVITDIQMPLLNGLDLIEELRAQNCSCKFIILSGYSEFEFAKKAIQLNVSEYLLKPVKASELYDVILRLSSDILSNTANSIQKDLMSLLKKGSSPTPFLEKNLTFPFYALIQFTCTDLHADLSMDMMKNLCTYYILVDNSPVEVSILLCFDDLNLYDFIKHRMKTIISSSSFWVSSIISPVFSSVRELRMEYQLNKAMLLKYSYFGESTMICRNDTSEFPSSENNHLPDSFQKRIQQSLNHLDFDSLKNIFEELAKDWKKKKLYNYCLSNQLSEIIFLIVNCSHFKFVMGYDTRALIEEAMRLQNYEKLYHFILDQLKKMQAKYVSLNRIETSSDAIVIVTQYIHNNYYKDLSVSSLSALVSLTPAYLSRLFKKNLHVSPMEYIVNYRIDKAKELLIANPDTSLKVIAESVGYKDVFHFSRSFKSIVGTSPSNFRNDPENF